ncbi:MAG: BlaI/MecI/CopY family transcriptional regulator [Bacteroidota bacterium]|jgi:BlaI family penicillinase repressor|nr:BlaI/MecI/CopY family transcriptional regulator [Bacteroidota bacterium]MCA4897177.1 BlaI/MecI/CopY family transcriptional regulator [Cytophagales bacterium]MCE2958430.1 BlaI/MecI/CopY family transcriptional regulator [Flammeovirgaceae bacterium]MCZ8069033.1 BlaI/MecI/CopY family transcriptional regulator [Cytophagales bacterium]
MKELTKAEDQIMQVLWKLKRAFVKDIIEQLPSPKPAYNTVSTIVRILEKKGFVGYTAYGKTHEYFPLVPKEKYTHFYLNNLVKGYFGGSFQNLVSFFASENKMDIQDIDQLLKQLEELKNKKP